MNGLNFRKKALRNNYLAAFLLLFSTFAFQRSEAQVYQKNYSYGFEYLRLKADSAFSLPRWFGRLPVGQDSLGLIFVNADSTIYFHNGKKLVPIGSLSVNGYGLLRNGDTIRVDTAGAVYTRWHIDSLNTALSASIALRLKITDTTGHWAPAGAYIHPPDTVAKWAPLGSYLHPGDTINQWLAARLYNAANGVAPLDASGKVPFANLPATLMIYKGTWNPVTNTPHLTDSSGTSGWVYQAAFTTPPDSVVVNLGHGAQTYYPNDYVIYDGTKWQWSPGSPGVKSINGFQGVVNLTTTNIPEGSNLYHTDARSRAAISLTTSGASGASTYTPATGVFNIPTYTLAGLGGEPAITAGTTAQYWRGDKSWQTLNTTAVPEGTNLYFTNARSQGAISVTSPLTYTAGVLGADTTKLAMQNFVKNYYTSGAGVTVNNSTGGISIPAGGITNSMLQYPTISGIPLGSTLDSLIIGAGLAAPHPYAGNVKDTIYIPAAGVTNAMLVNSAISGIALGGTLPTLSTGTHLAGSYNGTSAASITTDATNLNTASTIVARDASGNFSAGTITAALAGNATSANQVNNSLTPGWGLLGSAYNGSAAQSPYVDSSKVTTPYYNDVHYAYTAGGNATGTWPISITGTASGETLATVTGRGSTTTSAITALKFITSGGTASQFTMGDGSLTTGNKVLQQNGHIANLTQKNVVSGTYYWDGSSINSPYTYGTLLNIVGNGDQYDSIGTWNNQLAFTTIGTIDYRQAINANAYGAWQTLLTSSNYNSYSPTLTGSGASGTWGIGISGNAATATNSTQWNGATNSITTPASGQLFQFNGANWINWTPNYLTGNQSITVTASGAATGTGSGATSISLPLTLANVGTAGTYTRATFNAQGLETGGSDTAYQIAGSYAPAGNYITGLTGDVVATGPGSVAATLKNTGTPGTYGSATQTPVFTTDAQGRVTAVTNTTITPAYSSLTGVPSTFNPSSGSGFYIQNGTSQQPSASYNIDGSGTLNYFHVGTTPAQLYGWTIWNNRATNSGGFYSYGKYAGYIFGDRTDSSNAFFWHDSAHIARLFYQNNSSTGSKQAMSVDSLGNGIFAGTVTATAGFESSDLRLKNVIPRTNFRDPLSLRMITFDWKKWLNRDSVTHYGNAAQEVQILYPELVHKGADGYYSVNYTELHTLQIYQLKTDNEKLQHQISEQQVKLDRQQQEIDQIKRELRGLIIHHRKTSHHVGK